MSIDSSEPSSRLSSPSPVSTMSDSITTTSVTASSSATSLVVPFATTSESSSSPLDNDAQNSVPDSASPAQSSLADVDPQIIEALKSKDRIYVLKLGEQMESLIKERRTHIELTPATSYQRLLVHRCSAYHRLTIENDPSSKSISVFVTTESRIPYRRLADLVPPELNTQPAIKIMRRNLQERRSKPQSQSGSVAGEDADLSDVEPSESGSLGGRSNTSKKHMTIEEREAAYNEARSRIFMDFEGKEKEKDMSASSSSQSLASSSTGDFDDSASSLAADSDISGPSYSREQKDTRPGNSVTSSRSMRSSPFTSSGPASSRNSRPSSPSFNYASLYEPPPSMPYDQSAGHGFQTPQYIYPYSPPPGQPPNTGFVPPPFPYYHPYPYTPVPPHPQNSSDPNSPANGGEIYSSSPPVHYHNPYLWHPSHPHPQAMSAPNLTPASQGGGPSPVQNPVPPPMVPQLQNTPPYPHPPYIHQPMYSYPVPGYYTPQPNQPMHLQGHPVMYEPPRSMPENFMPNDQYNNHYAGRDGNPNASNHPRRNGNHYNNGVKSRAQPQPPPPKPAWSFGPGIGIGGLTFNGTASSNNGSETVGPRLSSMRRLSNNSNGNGGSSRNSSNWDEASSTASSSTSSSSRRTFTSTTSSTSQHPLPARPDWAVGLKPDSAPHNRHQHDHHGGIRNSGTVPQQMSPRNPTKRAPPMLHATDFPPLSAEADQRRPPTVAGAWSNQSPARSILSPPHHGNPLVYHPVGPPIMNGVGGPGSLPMSSMMDMGLLEDSDRTFERPPPKGSMELYNPKMPPKRPVSVNDRRNSQDRIRPAAGDVNGLTDQLSTVSMEGGGQSLHSISYVF